MTTWVTSDHHFGHANILGFRDEDGELIRPGFADVSDMNETLVRRWNAVVAPGDRVYHLGDFAWTLRDLREFGPRLNGNKRLVLGNHDRLRTRDYLEVGFQKLYATAVVDGVVLSHVPIHPESVSHRWRGNVHGHIHERPSPPGRYVNVSVERTDYTPVRLVALLEETAW